MGDLSQVVSSLRATTARLNSAADQANECVRLVEEMLGECGVGVFASENIRIEEDPNSGEDWCTDLAYARLNGKYRICTATGMAGDPHGEIKLKAWDELPRLQKLEAISVMPGLIRKLQSIITATVESAEMAMNDLSRAMSQPARGPLDDLVDEAQQRASEQFADLAKQLITGKKPKKEGR